MEEQQKRIIGYVFSILMIIIGLTLNYFNIGMNGMFSFSTVGNYLIYIGVIAVVICTFKIIFRQQRKVDERMMAAGLAAGRITIVFVILAAFIVMIIDGINTINIPYSVFMSYSVMVVILINLISYKLLLKYKY